MTLPKGTTLNGRYRIIESLGQGGMGSVYRAVDENLGIDVAVKENLFTSDDYSRQFRLEALILASVRHHHLPRVTDHFISDEHIQYLVMDYIAGEDLRQRMEHLGKITAEDAILIGAAVCDALAYLHTRKPPVLHRDIKPGNIKITPTGEIYLVDFGLAKIVHGTQTTTTGARAMTPGFSPPEQYGTARTDPRSDIYSLGATLYAALTGAIPEDGLGRVMDNLQLTPLRQHNPEISHRLAIAIEKAMAAYPDDRHQTAEEFRHALLKSSSKTQRFEEKNVLISIAPVHENATQSQNIAEMPEVLSNNLQNKKRNKLAWLISSLRRRLYRKNIIWRWAGSISILAALAWVMFSILQANSSLFLRPGNAIKPDSTHLTLPTTQFSAPTQTITPLRALPAATQLPTETPVGGGQGEIAFASDRTGILQVYVMKADGSDIRQITNEHDGACQPDWSPDGNSIVYVSPCRQKQDTYQGSSLFTLNLTTQERTILPASPGGDFDPAWSPDGKHIAFTSQRDGYMEIYTINLENNQFTRLTKSQSISGGVFARQPAWNPYGTQIVYVLKRQGLSQIWVTSDGDANIEKPNMQLVQSGNTLLDSLPTWSPDGQFILFNQTNFTGTAPFKLMSMRYEERASKQAVPLNIEPLPVVDADISPDGQWLVFESWPEEPFNQDIYITTISGAGRTRLTTDPGLDIDPVWRPRTNK